MYINEKDLRIRIYVDDEWPAVRRETTCTKKITYSLRSIPVVMEYVGTVHDDRKVKTKDNSNLVEMYTSHVIVELDNPPPTLPNNHIHAVGKTKYQLERSIRSRYYYFVIDDCSLEEQYNDNKIPDMTYTATVKVARWINHHDHEDMIYSEHLPADEDGIRPLLYVTILFSSVLLLLLLRSIVQTSSSSGGGEVHVAILIVIVACITNGLSAVCELIHMHIFSSNGIGNYSLDALSSHFEALSDSMVSLILLSIGGGWTLPSDVGGSGIGGINSSSNTNNKFIINPAGSLLNLVTSGGGAGGGNDRKGGIVAIMIIAIHAILAQWGRTFDDDFDTYHALEHPPGKALMILRFVLGLVFITGVGAVRSGSHGRCPPSLLSFLTKFALVGLSYFASLPGVSMFVGSALPYHRRHQALHYR
jgi:hypothetical protein